MPLTNSESTHTDPKPPAASVIVSVRNAGDFAPTLAERLRETVDRLPVEAIIVDDGSTDGTGDVLADALHGRAGITLIRHETSAGVAARRNEAVARARGEYIWFVDHDDDWSYTGLETLLRHSHGVDIVFARADFAWGPGASERRLVEGVTRFSVPTVVSGEDAASMLIGGEVHGFLWCKLFRRSLLGADPFPIIVSQSDVVGVAVAVNAATSVRVIPDLVYSYIRLPGSITRSRTPDITALKTAHDGVLSMVGNKALTVPTDVFTARFLCLAAVNTAVRWGVDRPTMRRTVASAAEWSRPLSLRAIRESSLTLAGSMALLRVAPPLLPIGLRFGMAILDAQRAVRSRFDKTDRTVTA